MSNNRDAPADRADTEAADGESSVLQRWSRRKLTARREKAQSSPETVDPAPAEPPAATQSLETGAEGDLPPLEALDEHSDFSAFLSPKVSQELRRLALRKLFHMAKFNVTDGLDDYAEDYTRFRRLGNVVTADMRLQMERLAERARQTLAQAGQSGAEQADAAHSRGPAVDASPGVTESSGEDQSPEPDVEPVKS